MNPFLAAAIGLISVPVVAVFVIAWTSFKPPRVTGEILPNLPGNRLQDVTLVSDGLTLKGWLVLPPDPRGVVLLAHGWGADATGMFPWSFFLERGGWASLALDMRGHGRSEGTSMVTLPMLARDLHQAAVHLESREDLSGLPLAALGHSMGGAAVLLALSQGLPAQAGIVSSAFARVESLTDYVLRKWWLPPALFRPLVLAVWKLRAGHDLGPIEPENTVQRVGVPLLLTHGTHDAVIPDREMEILKSVAPPGTRILTIPEADHMNLVDFEGYQASVLDFLDRHLSPSASGPRPPGPGLRLPEELT